LPAEHVSAFNRWLFRKTKLAAPTLSREGGFSLRGAMLNICVVIATKPPIIVHYDYRPKRTRKKKAQSAVITGSRIVSAKKPKPATPAIGEAVTERKRPAQAAAPIITGSRIVTARKPRGRFGDVPVMTAEEHQQRGDAAEALFRELTRRVCEE
jgi:hypothetical protein